MNLKSINIAATSFYKKNFAKIELVLVILNVGSLFILYLNFGGEASIISLSLLAVLYFIGAQVMVDRKNLFTSIRTRVFNLSWVVSLIGIMDILNQFPGGINLANIGLAGMGVGTLMLIFNNRKKWQPDSVQYIFRSLAIAAVIVFLPESPIQRTPDAELIITNAKIWTGNKNQPHVESMVIGDGKIIFVGDADDASAFESNLVEVIDAEGKMITPGFIDTHVHFMQGGSNLTSVQLRTAKTQQEFINRIGEFAKTVPEGTWITGGDWDHMNWGGELPKKQWVDSITKHHPLWINRLDGHMALANSKALELSGIGNSPDEIEGGEIVRDDGEITGIFKDNTMTYIETVVADPTDEVKQMHLKNAMDYVNSNGVTSVHNMGTFSDLDQFRIAKDNGDLNVRIYSCTPLSDYSRLAREIQKNNNGDEWVRIGGLKGFVDGSLGSHTAVFQEPYTDQPDYSGIYLTDMEKLAEYIHGATDENLHIAVHAIGDRAIHDLLNIYDEVKQMEPEKDHRFRIEHTQHLAAEDIPRFAEIGVVASMQPYHAIDDGRWADQVIGKERASYTYAFKSLMDEGAKVAFGSDWFVAPPTPLMGIYAAVTRRTLDDKNPKGWVQAQKITVEQALIAYTINAAYASFEERIKGTLEVGKLADFVILSDNLFEIDPKEIRNVEVLATYVDGNKVFELPR